MAPAVHHNRPCRGRVVDSSGLVILLWCWECALPGLSFFAGIPWIPCGRGMTVASLVALCSWAGFSYSSYSYAVAIAMGLSYSWMRRNALRCLSCKLLGRNEFRPVAEFGGVGRPRTITGAAANIITGSARYPRPNDTQHREILRQYLLLMLNNGWIYI